MKTLYFCRHGLSQLGKDGLWAGSTDTPLTSEGREQARAAGQSAKDLGIDHIISSPLSRAYDTARIIAAEIGYTVDKIEINDLLVERDFGELEATAWNPEFDLDSLASIEPAERVIERARLAYEYIQSIDADNILLVGHSGFGRALRHVIQPEIPFKQQSSFENAKVVRLL